MTDDGHSSPWIRNSASFSYSDTVDGVSADQNLFYILCWVNVGVSLFVLAHSYLLHEFTYTSVRIQTDMGAVFSIGSVIAITLVLKNPTRYQWALLGDLCYGYLFSAVIQLCDNYMFYSRLLLVTELPRWHRNALHAYIWIVLTATWLPANTIVPFFYNVNSAPFQAVYAITRAVSCWGNVAYNFYFAVYFWFILRRLYKQKNGMIGVMSEAETGGTGTRTGPGASDRHAPGNPANPPPGLARSPLTVLMHNDVTKIIGLKVRAGGVREGYGRGMVVVVNDG